MLTNATKLRYHTYMNDVQSMIEDLRNKKLRITKLRKSILKILVDTNTPILVSDLLKFLSKLNLRSHKTSVYRELAVLKKHGVIQEVQFGENKKRYEIKPTNHKHHLVCTGCEDIEDIVLEKDLDKQELKIMREKNFKVTSHSLEFFGLCASCNN